MIALGLQTALPWAPYCQESAPGVAVLRPYETVSDSRGWVIAEVPPSIFAGHV